MPEYATGGPIQGPPTDLDHILAAIDCGYTFSAEEVAAIGGPCDILRKINEESCWVGCAVCGIPLRCTA